MHYRVVVRQKTPFGLQFFFQTSSLHSAVETVEAYNGIASGFSPSGDDNGAEQYEVGVLRESPNTIPHTLTGAEVDQLRKHAHAEQFGKYCHD